MINPIIGISFALFTELRTAPVIFSDFSSIQRKNGSMRKELLDAHLFLHLTKSESFMNCGEWITTMKDYMQHSVLYPGQNIFKSDYLELLKTPKTLI